MGWTVGAKRVGPCGFRFWVGEGWFKANGEVEVVNMRAMRERVKKDFESLVQKGSDSV